MPAKHGVSAGERSNLTSVLSDTHQQHEWKRLFELMLHNKYHQAEPVALRQHSCDSLGPLEVEHQVGLLGFAEALNAALVRFFGELPGLCDGLAKSPSKEPTSPLTPSHCLSISLHELTMFLAQQPTLPMYHCTEHELREPDMETRAKLWRLIQLFVTIKKEFSRLGSEPPYPADDDASLATLLRDGLPFDTFYAVLATDQAGFEAACGEEELARELFELCDSLGDGNSTISLTEMLHTFSCMSEERYSRSVVEDFLHQFKLDANGCITLNEWIRKLKHLQVLGKRQ